MNKKSSKCFWKQSILSAAIIAVTVTGTVSAASEVPEGGWYQPKYHSDLDYSEMKYTGYDRTKLDAAIREMDEICSLGKAGQEERVEELYETMVSEIDLFNTQNTLNDLIYYKDVHNEEAQEESQKLSQMGNELGDGVFIVLKKAIDSPYGPFLREKIGESGVEQLEDYKPMTEREFELRAQDLSLVQEYDQALMDSYTAEVNGEEWTTERYNEEAPEDPDENYDVYLALSKEKNSVIGEIYKEMVQVRNGIAQENGYDNYADYAYKEIYARDFTTEEIKQVYREVKDKIIPLYTEILAAQSTTDVNALIEAGEGKKGEEILDEVEPYIGKIHPELSEAYSYMRDHHLYDIEADDGKMGVGFTATLYSYGVPFIFNSPSGYYGDYSTVIHEFGHYNQMFHSLTPSIWELSRMDVFEIHSQGLEMLFYPYADDLFGEGGEAFRYETVSRMLYGIREGCLYDEFQNTVYKNPDMSVEEINRTFMEIAREYGYQYPYGADQAYAWIEVPHTFESLCTISAMQLRHFHPWTSGWNLWRTEKRPLINICTFLLWGEACLIRK
ncbi:M2 family metallopeptidase [Clostridium sp. AM58-1XD]|uniref:M2 family metallopeptidase n=1 Tax=Clostridium sp. AM58-1XD TaxID=2292307 RepID=UPI000E556C0B|nr:M2 family metallopeptidase [Clostridium sp. AM58-1XD]RGY98362.1 hypothetical protein DXA13_11125 [Clostridium sp. AM58-1XD]